MDTPPHDDRDPIDVFVGARVRALRKIHGLSQQEMAARLGVSFQQVQKYEKAANRISGAMLYRIAALFDLPIGALFDGLPDTALMAPAPAAGLGALFDTGQGQSLAQAFLLVPIALRGSLVDIARAMAGAASAPSGPGLQRDQAPANGPTSSRPRSALAVSTPS